MERHRTDLVSLVFGLLFTVVAVIGITDVLELGTADVRWIAPALLVLLGLLLVLSAGRGRGGAEAEAARDAASVAAPTLSAGPAPPVDSEGADELAPDERPTGEAVTEELPEQQQDD